MNERAHKNGDETMSGTYHYFFDFCFEYAQHFRFAPNCKPVAMWHVYDASGTRVFTGTRHAAVEALREVLAEMED